LVGYVRRQLGLFRGQTPYREEVPISRKKPNGGEDRASGSQGVGGGFGNATTPSKKGGGTHKRAKRKPAKRITWMEVNALVAGPSRRS